MAKPDWGAIKAAYQTGESVRKIAKWAGVSHTAINNRAKKEEWEILSTEVSTRQKVSTGKQSGNPVETPKKTATSPAIKKEKKAAPDKEADDVDLFQPAQFGLSGREIIFVEEVHAGAKLIQAYLQAGYENNPKTAYKEASRLVRKPHIAKALRWLQTQRQKRYTVELDEVVQQLVAITRADPNLITQYRRVNCRHCWGEYYFYQWRDAAEFEEKKLEALARKHREPTDAGGYGFDSTLAPNPDCPRCNGEGVGEMVMGDTRDLDVNEHAFFLGIKQTKNGLEAITESKQIARAQLLKILEIKSGRKSGDPVTGEDPQEENDLTDEQLHEALQELGYGRRKNQLEEKLDDP